MLIQILGLSILSHTVFGGFVPENRQLVNGGGDSNTGNEWQYCEDKCTEVCHDCEVHHECGEGEVKCGEGPMKKGENGLILTHCKRDDICVSDDCFCKIILFKCQNIKCNEKSDIIKWFCISITMI